MDENIIYIPGTNIEIPSDEDRSIFNCPDCFGTGLKDQFTRCPRCKGKGKV